jgi:hypothetical protein
MNRELPEGGVILSFDDGAPELQTVIIPELDRRGIRAALFPITSVFEGKSYTVDRFYDILNRCNGIDFRYPDLDGTIRTTLLTPSEIRRIVQSNLKRRIVGMGESAHQFIDQLLELNGLQEQNHSHEVVSSIHAAVRSGWLIGLHGHHHLSFSLHDDSDVWNDIKQAQSTLRFVGIEPAPIIAVTDGRMPRTGAHSDFQGYSFLTIAQSFNGRGVDLPFKERWIVPPRNSAIVEAHQNGSIESIAQREEEKWHEGRPVGDWVTIQLNDSWIIERMPFRTKKNRSLHFGRRLADGQRAILKFHEQDVLDENEFISEILHLKRAQGRGVVNILDHGLTPHWGDVPREILVFSAEQLQPLPKLADPELAFSIWSDVVLALERIHNIGLVHCDVKPGNILLDDSGRAHLIDFAESIMIEDQQSREKVIRQEDVYNLGKLLHRLLTGNRVYVLQPERILNQTYPADQHCEIKNLILAMCDPDYRRPPSISELIIMSDKLRLNCVKPEVIS